jgi:beta-hydroxylase
MVADQLDATRAPWLRRWRRRHVKRLGKRAIRGLGHFLGEQSLVGDAPVLDAARWPWIPRLEAGFPAIRAELDRVLEAREALPPFQMISRDQRRITSGDRWKVYLFFGFGYRVASHCQRCPETTRLLEQIPDLQSAWFSILAPGAVITPHRGISKGIVRLHMGLKTPRDRAKCWMRVDDRVMHWDDGHAFMFDDTYDHEVRNDTAEERVILIVDVERPMRPLGRWIGKAFNRGIRWTAYVQDARRKQLEWDQRLEAMMDRAEGMHAADDGRSP